MNGSSGTRVFSGGIYTQDPDTSQVMKGIVRGRMLNFALIAFAGFLPATY